MFGEINIENLHCEFGKLRLSSCGSYFRTIQNFPEKLNIEEKTKLHLKGNTYVNEYKFDRNHNYTKWGGCPRGVMVKAMDCGIVVREFVL